MLKVLAVEVGVTPGGRGGAVRPAKNKAGTRTRERLVRLRVYRYIPDLISGSEVTAAPAVRPNPARRFEDPLRSAIAIRGNTRSAKYIYIRLSCLCCSMNLILSRTLHPKSC